MGAHEATRFYAHDDARHNVRRSPTPPMMRRIGQSRLRDFVGFVEALDSVVVVAVVSAGPGADIVLGGVVDAVSDDAIAALDVVLGGALLALDVVLGSEPPPAARGSVPGFVVDFAGGGGGAWTGGVERGGGAVCVVSVFARASRVTGLCAARCDVRRLVCFVVCVVARFVTCGFDFGDSTDGAMVVVVAVVRGSGRLIVVVLREDAAGAGAGFPVSRDRRCAASATRKSRVSCVG